MQESHNNVQLTRDILLELLHDLQKRVLLVFGCPIRLFVHGGAVMLLHPHLSAFANRRTTRDIDYIKRAFEHEWRKKGVHDADDRLQECVNGVAYKFRVGSDWMNADPDIALPLAREHVHRQGGYIYDPIYYDAKQPHNVNVNTIYTSPGLTLISVTMFWGVALKLVRYEKQDPADIVAILRHGTKLNGVRWTPQIMEDWLKTECWPMGYDSYQPQRMDEFRDRIQDAVNLLQHTSQAVANGRHNVSLRTHRPSMNSFSEHRIQNSLSHSRASARSEITPFPFERNTRPLSPLSPLSSPILSMPEPWIPSVFSQIPSFKPTVHR